MVGSATHLWFSHLVRPSVVHAAYQEADKCFPRQCNTTTKQQWSVPLVTLFPSFNPLDAVNKTPLDVCEELSCSSSINKSAVPPNLLIVAQALLSASISFLKSKFPSSTGTTSETLKKILLSVMEKSVFRVWRYEPGAGCRAHYDPGWCTALLRGSQPGLEINEELVLDPTAQSNMSVTGGGTYGDYSIFEKCDAEEHRGWMPVFHVAENPFVEENTNSCCDVLVFNDTMLQVVSNGVHRHLLHRVSATNMESHRVNIVLELRPANSREWYSMHQEKQE